MPRRVGTYSHGLGQGLIDGSTITGGSGPAAADGATKVQDITIIGVDNQTIRKRIRTTDTVRYSGQIKDDSDYII